MKNFILFIAAVLLTLLSACSDDETTPNDRFATYTDLWQEQNFSDMYDMVASESSDTYEKPKTEAFVDRYQTIYQDLDVSDVDITFDALKEEKLKQAMKEGEVQYPFTVSMKTLAGPIEFDYEATVVQEGQDENENWYVQWDPGFIFPPLKDGGDVAVDTISPKRGNILDRSRIPMALNDEVFEVGIVPEKFNQNENTFNRLANLLTMEAESIKHKLNQDWVESDLFVPLKKIQKSKAEKNALLEISGIQLNTTTGRVYPLEEAAAPLIGYVGQVTKEEMEKNDDNNYSSNDIIGKRGLEQLYEDKLRGEKGVQILVEQESGDVELAKKPVKDGENIQLTIDASIQKKIYDNYEDDAGTAAAIDPKTGETLALISSPTFNPNDMTSGLPYSVIEDMQNDPQLPLINKFNATFSPGSAIKPITAAIGLKNGSIKRDETLDIKGKTWSNGENWGKYEVTRVHESDKPVDLTDALVNSDNIYFAMQAVEMGAEDLTEGFDSFGFGEDVPFDYPIQTSSVSNDGQLSDEVAVANTGYGQGQIQISSLHLAMAYTTFLNEGNMLKPILFSDQEQGQFWKENLLSSDAAKNMQNDLRKVVKDGTGSKAQLDHIPIAGKTGTAELKLTSEQKDGQENGWFVGYPSEEEDILIAMMIEHTEDRGGSSYTAEKVADIIKEIKQKDGE